MFNYFPSSNMLVESHQIENCVIKNNLNLRFSYRYYFYHVKKNGDMEMAYNVFYFLILYLNY